MLVGKRCGSKAHKFAKNQNAFCGTNYAMTGDMELAFKSGMIAMASAGLNHGVESANMPWSDSVLGKSLARSSIGGFTSVASGGDFEDGFKVAFITRIAKHLYSASTNHEEQASWRKGEGPPSVKDEYGNTIYGEYDDTKPIPWDKNLFGDNEDISKGGCFAQGNFCSRIGNSFPGGAAISRVHDAWLHPKYSDLPNNAWTNWGTMPFAAGLTYTALLDDHVNLYLIQKNTIREY